ncbi:MAG: hypothetical protein CHACPFDD_02155 [Phycisphaerae bacterium]|nr:hypothetical protein [Phycisphaerae bacterium]
MNASLWSRMSSRTSALAARLAPRRRRRRPAPQPPGAETRPAPPADASRTLRPWRDDFARSYPSVGLTPARALALLQQADGGSPHSQFELFAEMIRKWPRLAAVENTRRLALTGLNWELAPGGPASAAAPGGPASAAASGRPASGRSLAAESPAPDEILAFCRDTLDRIERFRDVLDHLASAIGFGIAVAELVWQDGRLVDLVPAPFSRLIADPHEPWRLRLRTEQDPHRGVALDEQPAKWIVHVPRSQAGRHFDAGLLRASVPLYVAQSLSFKDWLIFSQIAGMPLRVAQFEPGTPEADKAELLRMLQSLGTDAVAVISKSVDLKLLEARQSADERPYQPLQEYCNNEITILWLGQHLTTDIRESGSRAAAEIHDRVREDLLIDDIADEAAAVRRDILTPIVRARFGPDAPVPHFRRSLVESVDTRQLAEMLAVAVGDLGLSVPQRWAHRALGIPEPVASEPVIARRDRDDPNRDRVDPSRATDPSRDRVDPSRDDPSRDRVDPNRDRQGAVSMPSAQTIECRESPPGRAVSFQPRRTVASRGGSFQPPSEACSASVSRLARKPLPDGRGSDPHGRGSDPHGRGSDGRDSDARGSDAPPAAALSVRPAGRTDLTPLQFFFDTALRRDYFIRRGQLEEILTDRYHRVYVAEIDQVLVGVAITTCESRLVNALVHPAYRGLGIGRALVEQSGAAEVRAKTDMSSGDPRPFYESIGFKPTGRTNGKGNIEVMQRAATSGRRAARAVTTCRPRAATSRRREQ